MATKVKDTPVLTGKDAARFNRMMSNSVKLSAREIERIMTNYRKITVR